MNARTLTAAAALLVSAGILAVGAASAQRTGDERVTRSAGGLTADRREDELRDPLTFRKSTVAPDKDHMRPQSAGRSVISSPTSGEIWIYDAVTELFFDRDGDGYYHYLRVRFDADTIYDHVYVYADLYLSEDGETWERYFSTDDFPIEGTSPFDEYEVETELVAGYPPGLYDVLIELYDADIGVLADEFGPFESANLSLLPLEDASHDGAETVSVTISEEYGGAGAVSWGLIALLLAGLGGKMNVSRRSGNATSRA